MAKHKHTDKIQTIAILEAGFIFVLLLVITVPNLFRKEEDGFEVERKWLIKQEDIPYDLSKAEIYDIYQTYINYSPEIRIRNINNGEDYVLTIKTDDPAFKGLRRTEQEYHITKDEYLKLLNKKEGDTIHKTRYSLPDKGNLAEIDIFHDQLEGLAYMEIEFFSTEKANSFQEPNWVIKDITTDLDYKNQNLSRNGIPNSFNYYLKERSKNE